MAGVIPSTGSQSSMGMGLGGFIPCVNVTMKVYVLSHSSVLTALKLSHCTLFTLVTLMHIIRIEHMALKYVISNYFVDL